MQFQVISIHFSLQHKWVESSQYSSLKTKYYYNGLHIMTSSYHIITMSRAMVMFVHFGRFTLSFRPVSVYQWSWMHIYLYITTPCVVLCVLANSLFFPWDLPPSWCNDDGWFEWMAGMDFRVQWIIMSNQSRRMDAYYPSQNTFKSELFNHSPIAFQLSLSLNFVSIFW